MGAYRNDGWDSHRRESVQPSHQFDYNASPQTLEELELEYKNEAAELMKIRDREEDEENFKHREVWLLDARNLDILIIINNLHSCTCHVNEKAIETFGIIGS